MTKPLTQNTGRRKQAVARVRLRPGTGTIIVNRRPFEDYFPVATHRMLSSEALRASRYAEYILRKTYYNGTDVTSRYLFFLPLSFIRY